MLPSVPPMSSAVFEEDGDRDLLNLTSFVNSRAIRRKRARSATREPSMDDALENAVQIIHQREQDILKAVEFGQGLLAEISDLQQRKTQLEQQSAHHESTYASRRRDLQLREYQDTIKSLEELVASKDADLKHKENALSRTTQQLTALRHELEEAYAEVKLLRIENIGLQQIVSRHSKQPRTQPPEISADGLNGTGPAVETNKKAQPPPAETQKELIKMYETQIDHLKQRAQEAEGLLEEERLRVATLQADQALKAYWATSGTVADLKAQIEELEQKNASLQLDCARKCEKLQKSLVCVIEPLRAELLSLKGEAAEAQKVYKKGLQVTTQLATIVTSQDKEQYKDPTQVIALLQHTWDMAIIGGPSLPLKSPSGGVMADCSRRLLLKAVMDRSPRMGQKSPTRLLEQLMEQKMGVMNDKSDLGAVTASLDMTSPRRLVPLLPLPSLGSLEQFNSSRAFHGEEPENEVTTLRSHLRAVTGQLIDCQKALDTSRQRVTSSDHLLHKAILAEETSAKELSRCVALMRKTQEMISTLRKERDAALQSRDNALEKIRARQIEIQQRLDSTVVERDVACRLAMEYEQKWHDAQKANTTAVLSRMPTNTTKSYGNSPLAYASNTAPTTWRSSLPVPTLSERVADTLPKPENQIPVKNERLVRDKARFQSLLHQFGPGDEDRRVCSADLRYPSASSMWRSSSEVVRPTSSLLNPRSGQSSPWGSSALYGTRGAAKSPDVASTPVSPRPLTSFTMVTPTVKETVTSVGSAAGSSSGTLSPPTHKFSTSPSKGQRSMAPMKTVLGDLTNTRGSSIAWAHRKLKY